MAAKSVCSIFRNVLFSRRTRLCCCRKRFMSGSPDYLSYTGRTHSCGELSTGDVGKTVVLCGWLQYERLGSFLVLRDWQGFTQAVITDEQKEQLEKITSSLHKESVLKVHGTVRRRPPGQENPTIETGAIEVVVQDLNVLNTCKKKLPFEIKEFHQVKESLRMEYRYLDLRLRMLQQNLRRRSEIIMKMREFLCNQHGFVDVETPTLFCRTPGGAKEFIVPTEHAGKFYSLPQSPQQFKQLLMVGGIDRYFQIAKCYRNEGSKPDRQPEFTQVDIEMSFSDQSSIMRLIEDLLEVSWPTDKGQINTPFPCMSYQEAMTRFGVDKPDTRFGMELKDISDTLRTCSIPVIETTLKSESGSVQAISITDGKRNISNKDLERLIADCQQGLNKLTVMKTKIQEDGSWQGGVVKSLDPLMIQEMSDLLQTKPGDIVVIAAGHDDTPLTFLGRMRLKCAEHLESKGVHVRDRDSFNFLWVDNFPLFLPKEDGSEGLESAHHPFTAPHPEDEQLVYTHPERVRSQHYDLVLNGSEIGGGSIRIHNAQLQRFVLKNVLKGDASRLEHLLEALESGCPPHGGIALGLDRLLAIICGAPSIRDVIAFPKTHDGKDPMSKAPAEVSQEDLDLYNIRVKT